MSEPSDWTAGTAIVLVRTCRHCGRRYYLPRVLCGNCGRAEFDAAPADGAGTAVAVTSTAVTSTAETSTAGADRVGLALVDLDAGIRVMARCAAALEPGARVQLTFAGTPPVPVAEATGADT